MNIDDLRQQQRDALNSTAAWKSFKEDLESKYKAALAYLPTEIKRQTGMELTVKVSGNPPHFTSGVDSCHISAGSIPEWLTIHFPGVNKEVVIENLDCTLKRNENGSWLVDVWKYRSEGPNLEFHVISPMPCIPLRIGWKRNVWWCGPEHNDKLAEAVVDALLEKNISSDFVLKEPKQQSNGCALAFVIILAACALTLVLATAI